MIISEGAMITSVEDIARFILGGDATFTVVSKKTGKRYTYKVRLPEDGKVYFVGLLTSPDDYQYLGILDGEGDYGTFRLTKKSRMKDDSPPVKTFRWVFDKAMRGDTKLTEQVEFWHEGQCCRCGRPLTVPESIAAGIGPVCAEK